MILVQIRASIKNWNQNHLKHTMARFTENEQLLGILIVKVQSACSPSCAKKPIDSLVNCSKSVIYIQH